MVLRRLKLRQNNGGMRVPATYILFDMDVTYIGRASGAMKNLGYKKRVPILQDFSMNVFPLTPSTVVFCALNPVRMYRIMSEVKEFGEEVKRHRTYVVVEEVTLITDPCTGAELVVPTYKGVTRKPVDTLLRYFRPF